MKKYILTLTIVLSGLFLSAQTMYTESWPNGTQKIKGNYLSAVEIYSTDSKDVKAQKMASAIKVGKWEQWYENGQLASVENYTNNVMTGQWKSWYQDGKVQYEIDFTSGVAVIYHQNGNKQSEGKMLPGMLNDGKWTGYHANGNKNFEGSYKSGVKDGQWKFYDEKGNHYFTEVWNNGNKAN